MAVKLLRQLYVSHFILMMPGLQLVETHLGCTHVHLLKAFQKSSYTITSRVLALVSS